MKKISYLLVFLTTILAFTSFAYRFICNGFLANGEERIDECGACDDQTAARWENPNLAVVVSDSPLPKGITKNDWQSVVTKSFAAWNSVSGSGLRFFQVNGSSPRQFGANDNLHEIFWITDKQEWRKLVGSGEFGTLGATLPRYTCGKDAKAKRTIFDADLVLNGMSHINWQLECDNEDCISIQTTLVHELGHFFGLDHPCLMCSGSIMSARAGFDLMHPVFDDMEGLRALYPDGSIGGFGSVCTGNSDCNDNKRCIADGLNRYCSQDCKSDGDCENGSICKSDQKVCTFIDGESAGARKKGENCTKVPCVEPMVCAGASESNFFCYMPCEQGKDCSVGQECVPLEDSLSICVTIKSLGDRCDHRDLCERDLFCVFENSAKGFCRQPCQKTRDASSGCPKDEVCELFEEGVELCVPLYENLSLDDPSDGFGREGRGGDLDRYSGKKQKESGVGCNNITTNFNDISLLFALLLFWLRWHRTRQKCANS